MSRYRPIRFVAALCACALTLTSFAGCASTASTRHLETHWDEVDGELREVKVEITAKTKAGLFGKVPEGVHDVEATWSEEKDTIRLGQRASIDNTAQVTVAQDAIAAMRPILEAFIGAWIAAMKAAPAPSPVTVSLSP